ncbi:MAG TPA: YdcF family protein [Xanthobacteraceae bacterium]|nr:YdcF family protein [Xanthobacteraceae bacterium]
MAVADSRNRQDGTSAAGAATPPRSRFVRLMRGLWRAMAVAVLACILAFAGGFLWFVAHVPTAEVVLDRNADGIVVLTGGASRIADGVELLAAGRAKRLLISGAHRATSSGEIARLVPEYGRLIACCVDLDHSVNTSGNAVETRRWVEDRGFRSLIVVTSSYHMPRTMAELARRMPTVVLVPFPVVTDKMRSDAWWSSAATAKLLFSEYLKYIVAQVRMRLETVPG